MCDQVQSYYSWLGSFVRYTVHLLQFLLVYFWYALEKKSDQQSKKAKSRNEETVHVKTCVMCRAKRIKLKHRSASLTSPVAWQWQRRSLTRPVTWQWQRRSLTRPVTWQWQRRSLTSPVAWQWQRRRSRSALSMDRLFHACSFHLSTSRSTSRHEIPLLVF